MTAHGPTVRAFAPGRVNLIGEHTDYNLGYSLPIALRLGTVAAFTPDADASTIHAVSATEPDAAEIALTTVPGEVSGWGAYVAGCVWALREAGLPVPGGRLQISSEVPVGSGLSSSAALECAVLLALTAVSDEPVPDRTELARLAQRAENRYVGAPTGLLDQLASLYGAEDRALLIDFRSVQVQTVPAELGGQYRLLVIDSHAPHRHSAGEYGERRASCTAAAEALGVPTLREAHADDWRRLTDPVHARRARHILTENVRVLAAAEALRAADYLEFGALMNTSHESMRDDFEITTDNIDHLVAVANRLGAVGARMTGGGFGGSVIALTEAEVAERITAELPGEVAAAGFPAPTVRSVRPGRGAHLVDPAS